MRFARHALRLLRSGVLRTGLLGTAVTLSVWAVPAAAPGQTLELNRPANAVRQAAVQVPSASSERQAIERQWQQRSHLRNTGRLRWGQPRSANFDRLHRQRPTYLQRNLAPTQDRVSPAPVSSSNDDRQVKGVSYIELGEGLPRILPEEETTRAPEPFPLERQRSATPIKVIESVPEFVAAEPSSLMAAYQDDDVNGVFDDLDALVPSDTEDDLPSLDETLPELDESGADEGILSDLEPLEPPPSSTTPETPLPPDSSERVFDDDLGEPGMSDNDLGTSDDLDLLDQLDDDDTTVPNDDLSTEGFPTEDLPTDDLPTEDLGSPSGDLSTDGLPFDDSETLPELPGSDPLDESLPESTLDDREDDLTPPERNRDDGPITSPSDEPSYGDDEPAVAEPLLTRDEVIRVYNGRDCPEETTDLQEAWSQLRRNPVRTIDLDITPSIEPNRGARVEQQAREENLSRAPARQWRNRLGRDLGYGKMVDFRNGRVYIDDEGQERALSWYDLSNADLCFVTAWWELPSEFNPAVPEYQVRNWTMMSFTWKASGLCHKPLYFEEVALERYGHSAGPVKQVALSGVHFFGSIFFLPYNMGVSPPTECKYSLGYYRPGSCAPWLVPAVPLSARGARWQIGAVAGGLTLLP